MIGQLQKKGGCWQIDLFWRVEDESIDYVLHCVK